MKTIIRRMIFASVGGWLLATGALATQTNKSGSITANQTWSDTINVTGNVTITAGTVTVRPKTLVRFGAGYSINVSAAGSFTAVGKVDSTITFTAQSNRTKGAWRTIIFANLTQKVTTAFAYCTFEYATTATEFRNNTASGSRVTFDHCAYHDCNASGIYICAGWEVTVSYTTFHAMWSTGIFSHAADTLKISYCTLDSCNASIVCAGNNTDPGNVKQTVTINHVTINRTDFRMGTRTYAWDGDAIFTGNPPTGAKLTITNSIINYATKYGFEMDKTNFTLSEDYNCWCGCWLGAHSDNSDVGSHCLPEDTRPMLVDTARQDFRLKTGSPCIGKASDGSNMGCSQEVVSSGINETALNAGPQVTVEALPNPFAQKTTITLVRPDKSVGPAAITIYNMQGKEIRQWPDALEHIIWDGTDNHGLRVAAGLYFYVVRSGSTPYCQGTLLVTTR